MQKTHAQDCSAVWAKRQIRLRCLEGLDEAVSLTVSEVNEVIFNREVIICHNGATEQTAAPLDQILPNTVHRCVENKTVSGIPVILCLTL